MLLLIIQLLVNTNGAEYLLPEFVPAMLEFRIHKYVKVQQHRLPVCKESECEKSYRCIY